MFVRNLVLAKVYQTLNPKRPISTNGGRGAAKRGLRQEEHTIIHTSESPPQRLPEEIYLNKRSIRVMPVNPTEKLDPISRVNLGKSYPVEHNVKVCLVGQIIGLDLRTLLEYHRNEVSRDFR